MQFKTDQVTTFQENIVPSGTKLAGLAALAHALGSARAVRRPSTVPRSISAAVTGKKVLGPYSTGDIGPETRLPIT